jgi:hypothetical protein
MLSTELNVPYVGSFISGKQRDLYMLAHRFEINNEGQQLLYKHLKLPNHSIVSMKVKSVEKLCHHTNRYTPFRRQREGHWIRKVGTAFPYGCNDNTGSPQFSNVNGMVLFSNPPRRKRTHGHHSHNNSIIHAISFDSYLSYVKTPLGVHHICTKLYSIPKNVLFDLHEKAKASSYLEFSAT